MIKKYAYKILIFSVLFVHSDLLNSAEERRQTPRFGATDSIKKIEAQAVPQEHLQAKFFAESNQNHPKEAPKTAEHSLYLNFENASLGNVFSYLAKQKNINYVPNPALDAQKISMTSSHPMTLDEAWNTLLTLMESCNFTIIKQGEESENNQSESDQEKKANPLYLIVPSAQAKTNPLPVFFNHSAQELPDNNAVIRFLYVLKNIKTEAVKPIFDSMLAPGSVQYLPQMGACIITEKSLSIKTVMHLIEELDKGGIREAIKIYPLKHANAMDVAKLFNEEVLGINKNPQQMRIITPPGEEQATFFSKESKIIPDLRTNNLILIGNDEGLNRLISFIDKYIDKPLESVHSRLHVKSLNYVDAEKIKPILDSVIKSPEKQNKSPLVGEIKFFEDVVIAAESASSQGNADSPSASSGNRLVVACNKDDWQRIDQFIDALDKPRSQVAMEVLLVDVQRDTNKKLGSQIRNKKDGMIGKHINAETMHLAAPENYYSTVAAIPNRSMIPAIGSSFQGSNSALASFGREGDIWGVMRSVIRTNNFNILSQPYLIAHSQKKASLDITEQRVVNGELKQSGVNIVRNKETVSAKLNISITPRINTEGLIELTVDLTQQEFSSSDATGENGGDHSNRKLTTRATIGEGEVLILGGLTRKKIDEALYKTPILGDIPIIKWFFSSKEKRVTNEELFVFIRPTLIKPSFEGKPEEYTQLKLDYARTAISRQEELLVSSDPIDRWFFDLQPKKTGSLETVIESQEIRQLNGFMEGKHQPKSVAISNDPYYVPEEEQTKKKHKSKRRHTKA